MSIVPQANRTKGEKKSWLLKGGGAQAFSSEAREALGWSYFLLAGVLFYWLPWFYLCMWSLFRICSFIFYWLVTFFLTDRETNEATLKTRISEKISSPSDHLKSNTAFRNRAGSKQKWRHLRVYNQQRHSCRDIVRFQWETNEGTPKMRMSSPSDHLENNTTRTGTGAGSKLKWRHLRVYENNDNFQTTAAAPQLSWHYPFPDNK